MNNKIVSFVFCFFPTLFFLLIKWRPEVYGLLRGNMSNYYYNWEAMPYHTLYFLRLLSIDMLKFLFILHWQYGFWQKGKGYDRSNI